MKEMVAASLLSVSATESGLVAEFRFAGELPIFEGHFPGDPLVPGVFLIEAVRTAVERLHGNAYLIAAIDDARFSNPVRPDVTVRTETVISKGPGGLQCDAVVRTPSAAAAKVRMLLVPAPSA